MKTTKNSNTVVNNSNTVKVPTSVTKSIVSNRKAKRKAKKSVTTILRTTVNNNWKKEVFSLSGLIRYAKGKGAADMQSYIDAMNHRNGSKLQLAQITTKLVTTYATDRELIKKDGTKKVKFSLWLVILVIGRATKPVKKA